MKKYSLVEALFEGYISRTKKDPKFPPIKVGTKESFKDVLDFLEYKPTTQYVGDSERPKKYSLSTSLNVMPSNSHYAKDVKNRRTLKRAWMFTANHDFFKKDVYPVFWYGWTKPINPEEAPKLLVKSIKKHNKGRTTYETSAVGYLDPLEDTMEGLSQSTPFGFEIQGRITLSLIHI